MPTCRRARVVVLFALATAVTAPTADAQNPPSAPPPAADSAYATAALRALVAAAARGNELPAELRAYKANVETEIAIAARYDEGSEVVVALEQVASTLRWTRTGYYDQHVVGYRAQQAGLTVSMLGAARGGWAAPTLYGNRLRLRAESSRGGGRRNASTDTLPVVHPLAEDRDAHYRFDGGDTVVTLRAAGRAIPIVRVRVEPRGDQPRRVGLFRGELELDATRHHVVRLRGHFLVAPPEGGVRARLARAAMSGYAFVEYVNAERVGPDGERYWLPAYQRVDLQAASAALGDTRGVVHIVSRFTDVAVNDTALSAADVARADSLRLTGGVVPGARRLTLAGGDTLARHDAWARPIGAATAETHGDDFLDVAPDRWRPAGAPRAEFVVARGSDLFHFNRVEGVYTGLGGRVRFRDAAPGLTLRAAGGWAWSEGAARGRVEVEQAARLTSSAGGAGGAGAAAGAPRWTLGARAGRSLDLTNDFRLPLDSGSTVAALLFSRDDYDYVDRRFAALAASRRLGARDVVVRLEVGAAEDRGAAARLRRGVVRGDTPFRPNRPVDAGRYARAAVTLDVRPGVSGDFLRPGVGARVYYEGAAGDLDWQRVELRVAGRRTWAAWAPGVRQFAGTLVAGARVDAGALFAARPPRQQLFELGDEQALYGYAYKEFAGDRAAVARGTLMYLSPWGRAPLRLTRAFVLPGINPGLSVGLQAGWADASGAAARDAVARLAPDSARAARVTNGVRSSVVAGLRFFGGSTLVGVARPLDRGDRWRGVVSFAQGL